MFIDTQFCDAMRLSVEFVTVGFLGICRQFCCDWFQVSWRADEVTPERGTPIIECWKTCQLELRPVLLGSPSTVMTRQFIRLPVTLRMNRRTNRGVFFFGVTAAVSLIYNLVAARSRRVYRTINYVVYRVVHVYVSENTTATAVALRS